jgi:drug/metabolite transporter (DMT)-like permease
MSRLQANALLLLAALIWGSAFVGQVQGMDGLGPLMFTSLRFALGALVVLPLAWREWRGQGGAFNRHQLGWMAGLGSLLCIGVVMQQIGLMHTSVTHAGFLTALYVPLVPFLGWLTRGHRPSLAVWLSALGCLVGTWLLSGASAQPLNVGDVWVMLSALPWAVHVLWVGHAANRIRGAYLLACGQFAVCSAISGALALAIEPWQLAGIQRALGAIVYTGVMSVGLGFTLQVVGQRHAQPADAAIILSSETVFSALFGACLLGDRLPPLGLAGCALILASILAVQIVPLLRSRAAPAS